MIEPLKIILRLPYAKPGAVRYILNRGELPFILNQKGLVGQGVEVGVKHGGFSEFLLKHWKGQCAVNEFAAAKGYRVVASRREPVYKSWFEFV